MLVPFFVAIQTLQQLLERMSGQESGLNHIQPAFEGLRDAA
jgi:hypothetical protein